MKMEHYLAHTDYPIWEVIQKGNGPVSVSTDTNRVIKVLSPKTTEEILAREIERKARTTLLMALLEDHLAKFHKMTDAKEMWEAIKSRFGGNDELKKMQKYIMKQQFEGFSVSNSKDANQKFFRSLPAAWSQVSLIMRTKPGVDTLSFDDLYNNLRVFESDVKGSNASSSSTQNVAFVSSENTSDTNDVSTTYGASSSSGHNPQREGSSSYTDEQCRSKGNQDSRRRDAWNSRNKAKDSGRRSGKQEEPKALVTLDGDGVDWTSHSEDEQENYALMAYSNSGSDTEKLQKKKEDLKAKVEKWHNSSKSLNILLNSKMSVRDKAGLGFGNQTNEGVLSYENEVFHSLFDTMSSDIENTPVNDRYAEGMHVVPPPLSGTFIPSKPVSNSSVESNESVPTPVANEPKPVSDPKVWSDALIIKEYESDSDGEHVYLHTKEQETPSFAFDTAELNKQKGKGIVQKENKPVWNNVQRVNHKNQFVPTAVLTRTGIIPVNTVRDKEISVIGGIGKTIVKPSADYAWRPKRNYDDPHKALKNKGIVNSGCSRHMAGNKAYLDDYQDYNGGPVAFGGSKGYITGKGKIRTGKLNFEDVCFMKELHLFNLFFVSQICDKKNKVLFTDTECLVLSPDFKLPGKNQVLLRVPRQNNMYSFNLENIVPTGGLACLIAKATVD
ncbi:hypothetical protein Tco_1319602 [Tanacetum coccineum]